MEGESSDIKLLCCLFLDVHTLANVEPIAKQAVMAGFQRQMCGWLGVEWCASLSSSPGNLACNEEIYSGFPSSAYWDAQPPSDRWLSRDSD